MLNELVQKYLELSNNKKSIEDEMTELKSKIVSQMEEQSLTKFTNDNDVTASIVYKETIKYDNESAIIEYLKNNNMSKYVIEKINATSFNKELKTNRSLNESLNTMFSSTIAPTLSVK